MFIIENYYFQKLQKEINRPVIINQLWVVKSALQTLVLIYMHCSLVTTWRQPEQAILL